jgi:hypothetical protein
MGPAPLILKCDVILVTKSTMPVNLRAAIVIADTNPTQPTNTVCCLLKEIKGALKISSWHQNKTNEQFFSIKQYWTKILRLFLKR